MSMATLEREILANAKVVLCNKKLRMKDILEWSTGDVKAKNDDEVVVRIANPGVNICVKKELDKQP